MDRRTALDILEAVRPDSDDLRAPDVAEAAEFLARDPEAEAIFLSRQAFDREVGPIVRDVPVPSGLKERLLERLAAAGEPDASAANEPAAIPPSAEVAPSPAAPPVSRRRAFRRRAAALTVVAAMLLVALVFWFWQRHSGRLTMDELLRRSPFDATAAAYEGSFQPELPYEFQRAQNAGALRVFRPVALDGNQDQPAYHFVLPLRHRSVEGVLLVVPAARVVGPPQAESLHAAPAAPYGPGGYSTVAWSSGEFVYVCYVRGGGDSIETLRRALAIAPA